MTDAASERDGKWALVLIGVFAAVLIVAVTIAANHGW